MNSPPTEEPNTDAVTRRVLGVEAYLDEVTPHSELARVKWQQLASSSFPATGDRSAEIRRLQRLDAAVAPERIDEFADALGSLPTLERLFRRLDASETLRDADFFELKRFLYHAVLLLESADGLDELPGGSSAMVRRFREAITTLHPEHASSDRFHLADELDPRLAEQRDELRDVRKRARKRRRNLESAIIDDHGGHFDIHGHYHPEDDDIDDARLAVHEGRYIIDDPSLTTLDQHVEQQHNRVRRLEQHQRRRLTQFIATLRDELEEIRRRLVDFDLAITRIELRRRFHGCWPRLDDSSPWLELEGGRHPSLLEGLDARQIQPIDVKLTQPGTVVLGPNMGGKTALLRLIGLASWCAQMALPVPADHCRLAIIERIVYVGSEEPYRAEQTDGLSSFGREVRRFMQFWDSEETTLWLLDEPCRGTHPDEGTRLAAAIGRRRVDAGDRVLMATHFPGLAEKSEFARLRIAGLDTTEDLEAAVQDANTDSTRLQKTLRQRMDYRVVDAPQGDVPRDGWRIARALGLEIPPPDE